MLGSLKSSSSSSHHDEEAAPAAEEPPADQQQVWPHLPLSHSSSTAHHLRRLLITCAELVAQSDFPSAHRLISILLTNCSPYGDSTERLVHQFVRALSIRITDGDSHQAVFANVGGSISSSSSIRSSSMIGSSTTVFTSTICKEHYLHCSPSSSSDSDYFQSCYLWLNQITPFIRFSHLTANQAILDATEELGQQTAIHILDMDIMQGLQWPPLMQALAERSASISPPMLRITGCGRDLAMLSKTGDRLTRFAQSLGIRFHFQALIVHDDDPAALALCLRPSALSLVPEEALAINCVLFLHKLLNDDDPRDVRLFLSAIKALNPKIVTVAEREANHNHPVFLERLMEAFEHYTAVFDSLEATLPPNSRERLTLEQTLFGREIADILAAKGRERRQRHQRFDSWEVMFRSCGFGNVPLSGFALSQAKLLLRLHYPSEGYQLQLLRNSLFLGWQNRLLFSVSSWH